MHLCHNGGARQCRVQQGLTVLAHRARPVLAGDGQGVRVAADDQHLFQFL
jgi:hypothetical protein